MRHQKGTWGIRPPRRSERSIRFRPVREQQCGRVDSERSRETLGALGPERCLAGFDRRECALGKLSARRELGLGQSGEVPRDADGFARGEARDRLGRPQRLSSCAEIRTTATATLSS